MKITLHIPDCFRRFPDFAIWNYKYIAIFVTAVQVRIYITSKVKLFRVLFASYSVSFF